MSLVQRAPRSTATERHLAPAAGHHPHRRWLAAGLALVLVGLALRLLLLVRSNWLLEGDDALSALMALGILHGDRPLMLKNQTYAAAYEPYAMALAFAGLGISRAAAKLPELLNSLLLIGTSALLGRAVAGAAAAGFAAALMAVPPAYVLVLSLKPWAPYTEVMLLGSITLLCSLRLAWPKPAQADGRWSLAAGLCGGLALWMHPLAVWYLAPAAISIVLGVRGRRWRATLGGGLLGLALGLLPVLIFNLQTDWSTVRFILKGSQGQTADRAAVLSAWWNADVPRGAGLWHPWGPSPAWLGGAMAVLLAGALAWAVLKRGRLAGSQRVLGDALGALAGSHARPGPRVGALDTLLLFLAGIPVIFVLSGFGGPALNPYGFDATGRYAPPIWSGLAVVLGAALACVWHWRRSLALALACVPLGVNLVGLASIDPGAAFQSPYWDRLPLDHAPLLNALRDEGITSVWMNHWAGQPAMFDAAARGQALIAYDWYDVQAGGIDRFPEYRALVEQAARPAFVLVTDEAQPELERVLQQRGVAYRAVRVAPYVIVVPLSRRVDPAEVTPALDYRY